MIEALTVLVLVLVAALVTVADRDRQRIAYWRAETLAAERDLRAATGSPRCPRRRPERRCDGFTYTQTIDTPAALAEWVTSTDGHSDVFLAGTPTPRPALWTDLSAWADRIARPKPRILPDWWRHSTDEVRAIVEGVAV